MDNQYPDVILVKKTFPKLRKRQRKRYWKLKHFEDADPNMDDGGEIPEVDEDANEDMNEAENERPKKKMSKKQMNKLKRE